MGTGGPLRLAKDLLTKDNEEGLFFCFNSDVICNFPLKELLEFHKSHGGEGTLVTTKVEEPSRFGVILTQTVILSDEAGKINEFVEKPQVFVGNDINAGLYLLNTSMIDRIEERPTSIEREIFPQMAADGKLYTIPLHGFWKDIGQPPDFLKGSELYLNHLEENKDERLAHGDNIRGSVMIHPTATVSEDALIGPNVSIGENVVVESGARIKNSCIFPDTKVCKNAFISETIVGRGSTIGKWSRIENLAVIADDVVVKDELFINGSKILPHKSIDKSYYQNGDIIM